MLGRILHGRPPQPPPPFTDLDMNSQVEQLWEKLKNQLVTKDVIVSSIWYEKTCDIGINHNVYWSDPSSKKETTRALMSKWKDYVNKNHNKMFPRNKSRRPKLPEQATEDWLKTAEESLQNFVKTHAHHESTGAFVCLSRQNEMLMAKYKAHLKELKCRARAQLATHASDSRDPHQDAHTNDRHANPLPYSPDPSDAYSASLSAQNFPPSSYHSGGYGGSGQTSGQSYWQGPEVQTQHIGRIITAHSPYQTAQAYPTRLDAAMGPDAGSDNYPYQENEFHPDARTVAESSLSASGADVSDTTYEEQLPAGSLVPQTQTEDKVHGRSRKGKAPERLRIQIPQQPSISPTSYNVGYTAPVTTVSGTQYHQSSDSWNISYSEPMVLKDEGGHPNYVVSPLSASTNVGNAGFENQSISNQGTPSDSFSPSPEFASARRARERGAGGYLP